MLCSHKQAAWGERQKNNTQLTIRSYELGVLFLPPTFGVVGGDRPMRLPFDYPLVKYVSGTHEPWLVDGKYAVADVHGCVCNAE
jgi:tyrosyl-DNA phosphodiesterase-1